MSTVRRTALTAYKTQLEAVSFVQTVVIRNHPIELMEYAKADLPLVVLQVPDSTPDLLPGMQFRDEALIKLEVYFLNWAESEQIHDSYFEQILEGTDFVLSPEAVLDFMNNGKYQVIEDVEYPLDGFRINLYLRINAGGISDI